MTIEAVSMSEVTPIAQDAILSAEAWFASLDRSIIGSFALDEELITIMHASESLKLGSNGRFIKPKIRSARKIAEIRRAGSQLDAISNMVEQRLGFPGATSQGVLYLAELYFWWERMYPSNTGMQRLIAQRKDALKGLGEAMSRLHKAADNPDERAFYELGIWDKESIERFTDTGVDASIAADILDIPHVGISLGEGVDLHNPRMQGMHTMKAPTGYKTTTRLTFKPVDASIGVSLI